jgi:hypothetical protein
MVSDNESLTKVAKTLGVTVNTLKKNYPRQLKKADILQKDKTVGKLVTVSKAHGATDDEISEAVGVSRPTLSKRYRVELNEGFERMGKVALESLFHRVQNGTKEVNIGYEVTACDANGKPIEQKVTFYTEKIKECSTRDLNLLINLTTNGISFKDSESIQIQKERYDLIKEVIDKQENSIDYSVLSVDELKTLQKLMSKAKKEVCE